MILNNAGRCGKQHRVWGRIRPPFSRDSTLGVRTEENLEGKRGDPRGCRSRRVPWREEGFCPTRSDHPGRVQRRCQHLGTALDRGRGPSQPLSPCHLVPCHLPSAQSRAAPVGRDAGQRGMLGTAMSLSGTERARKTPVPEGSWRYRTLPIVPRDRALQKQLLLRGSSECSCGERKSAQQRGWAAPGLVA